MAVSILGIDYGAKRVGVALARDGRPQRLVTLSNDEHLLHELGRLMDDHAASTVVVGLPRNLDGDDTAQTAVARAFAATLEGLRPGLAVVLQDEAMTSELARQRLAAEKVVDGAAVLDAEAAVILLEDYLEAA